MLATEKAKASFVHNMRLCVCLKHICLYSCEKTQERCSRKQWQQCSGESRSGTGKL